MSKVISIIVFLALLCCPTLFSQNRGQSTQPSIAAKDIQLINNTGRDVKYSVRYADTDWTNATLKGGYQMLWREVSGPIVMYIATAGYGPLTYRLNPNFRFQIVVAPNGCLVVEQISSK